MAKIKKILKNTYQLKLQYQSADVQNISLCKDLETAQKKSEEMSQLLIGAQLQIADLKTAVSKAEVTSADMASKLEEYESKTSRQREDASKNDLEREKLLSLVKQKDDEIKALKTEVEENTRKITESLQNSESDKPNEETRYVQLAQELEAIKKKESLVCVENRSLESKVDEFQQRYEDLMESKVKIESQLHDTENKLKTTKQTLKKVDKENKKLLAERDSMRKEKESMEAQIKELNDGNSALKSQLVELEQSITQIVEEKLVSLQEELRVEEVGRKNLESQIADLRYKSGENEKIVDQLQTKRMESAKEHQEEMRMKQVEVDECREKYQEQVKQYEAVLVEKEDLELRGQHELENLKRDLDLARCDYEKVHYQLEGELLCVKESRELIQKQLTSESSAECGESIKALATQLIGELVTVRDSMALKDDELEKAMQAIESQAKSIKDLELAAEDYERERTDINTMVSEKSSEIEQLKIERKEKESLQQNLESKLMEMKKESDAMKHQWDTDRADLSTQIKNTDTKIMHMDEEMRGCRQSLEEKSRELENLQSDQLQKQRDADNVNTEKLSRSESKVKEQQAEMASLQKSLEEQKTKFQSVQQGLQQEISSLKFELSSQQMEHQEALQVNNASSLMI